MLIDFASLKLGRDYDRPELAQLWGYKSFHALGRGVFTPAGHNAIVLFITEQQQPALPQYQNSFDGEFLWMDGEDGHKSDNRLANSLNRDTVRLFHRKRDHSLFRYFGEVSLIESFLVAGPRSRKRMQPFVPTNKLSKTMPSRPIPRAAEGFACTSSTKEARRIATEHSQFMAGFVLYVDSTLI